MPNVSSLRAEVKECQRYWRTTEPTQLPSSPNLAKCHEHADEDIFPNIRTQLRIGCTLPVGSCEAGVHSPACDVSKPTYATGWGKIGFLGLP